MMLTMLPTSAAISQTGVLDFLGNAIFLGPQGLETALSIVADTPSESALQNARKILHALEPALDSEGLDSKPLRRVLEETGGAASQTTSPFETETLPFLRLAAVLKGYPAERYARAVSHSEFLNALSGACMSFALSDPAIRRLKMLDQSTQASQELAERGAFAGHTFERHYDVLGKISVSPRMMMDLVQEKRTGKLFAARRTKDPVEMEKLKTEFSVLQNLEHPGIVSEIKLISDPDEVAMIIEYLPGMQPLSDILSAQGRFNEAEIQSVVEQLLEVLQYIHARGVIHRNIQPENLLLYRDASGVRVTLSGFASPKFLGQHEEMRMGEDTDFWMAPEQIAGGTITNATDIYGLGLLALAMAVGKPLQIDDLNPKATVARLRNEASGYLSSSFLDLVDMLVDVDPQKRLGVYKPTRMAALVAVPKPLPPEISSVAESSAKALGPYVTSAEALDHLCHTHPDSPISYGIGKILGSAGLLAVAGGIGYFGIEVMGPSILRDIQNFMADFRYGSLGWFNYFGATLYTLIGVLFGGIGIGSAGFGLYFGADGVFSLMKPFQKEQEVIRGVYYRNGGFTKKPSWSDKMFGKKVFPVDVIEEGMKRWEGSFLLNNVMVRKTDIKAHTYYTPITVGNITTMQEHTVYTVTVLGNFNGQEIRAYTETEDEDFAEKLVGLASGSHIYIMGKLDKDGDIDVEKFGAAIVEKHPAISEEPV